MNKITKKLTLIIAAFALMTVSGFAALLVELSANFSGPSGVWKTHLGSFPGTYDGFSEPPAPVKVTDANGVTAFSTASANSGNGFFGGDNGGGSAQAPTGNTPQFVLSSGNFTVELWVRKRGNRFSGVHNVFSMKAADVSERFLVNLFDAGNDADEGRIDLQMRDDDPTTVNNFDVTPMTNNGADDPFDHFVFTWDNATSFMDVFLDGTEVVSDSFFSGVTLDTTTVWDGTVILNGFAGSGGNARFNGDISRVRIHDGILTSGQIISSFNSGANASLPEPSTLVMMGLGMLITLTRRNLCKKSLSA